MLTQGSLTQKKITQKRLTQFSPYFIREGNVQNPLFWYEADSVEKDLSDAVSILYDKSRNGFHLVQATQVSKPLLIENYQNGQPALRFDGSNDFMRVAFGQTFNQPNTIYAVWNRESGGLRYLIDGFSTSGRTGIISEYLGNNRVTIFTGTTALNATKALNNIPFITKGVFNGTVSQIYDNGTLLATGNAGTTGTDGITLGARNGGGGEFLNGHILALLGFNRLLSFSEDLNVMNYLNQKYGVF
jgi:hypothetical protein